MKLTRLREVRELHGWSQSRLAEESGVSRDGISNYETGHREAWPSTAKKLADALGVEIADLVARAEEPALAGKAEAPETGIPLLERALNAARRDEKKVREAIARSVASEGRAQSVTSFDEDRFRAELRRLGFPDEYFEDFIWPLVVKAARGDALERELAAFQEHERAHS